MTVANITVATLISRNNTFFIPILFSTPSELADSDCHKGYILYDVTGFKVSWIRKVKSETKSKAER